ncbi:MAG: hypothetical protein KJ709_02890 [Nanoarchaeota archaeon]|nr:hypothetical protein [Nanoarchaeota archaeon]
MVSVEGFKKAIEDAISQDYQIEYLGKNFDKTVGLLTEAKAAKIYRWVDDVARKNIQPILVGSDKPYKGWTISELLTFRYPFSIGRTEYRVMLVKVKNSIYIEFHLGNHKYYDKVRKELDLRNKS